MNHPPLVRLESLPHGAAFRFPRTGLTDHVRSATNHAPSTAVIPLTAEETAADLAWATRTWQQARQAATHTANVLAATRALEADAATAFDGAPTAETYRALLAAFDLRFITAEPAHIAAQWNVERAWRRLLIARYAHLLASAPATEKQEV